MSLVFNAGSVRADGSGLLGLQECGELAGGRRSPEACSSHRRAERRGAVPGYGRRQPLPSGLGAGNLDH